MIKSLADLKDFLTWARENGVAAVKFTDGGECRPVDVVFGRGLEAPAGLDGPVPHHKFEGDEIVTEEVEPTDDELFASSG